MYIPDLYRDSDGRSRWGVLHQKTGVWYFANRYGERPARGYAARLNRGAV